MIHLYARKLSRQTVATGITGLLLLMRPAPAISQDTGPAIIRYEGTGNIFPASWLDKKTRARASAADTALFRNDSTLLYNALGMYPSWLIERELKNIFVVGKLSFNRQYFTGTNSKDAVYIAGEGNSDIEKTFHHEFSSILLRNHSDLQLEKEWRSLSPALRQGNSASAVQAGLYSVDFDSSLCVRGYLSPYSLSNWENDFNIYAENIFAGGAAFWAIADHYPSVSTKMKLVVGFYHSIWPGYTETFFRAAIR